MARLEPTKGGYYLWKYLPSMAGAVIFAMSFCALMSMLVWKTWRSKAKFCIPFVVGGFLQFVGYCARAAAHNKTGSIMTYAIQNMFILVAPALFAATIYMMFGRLVRNLNAEHHSVIRISWLTKAFVWGDVLSFLVQGSSAGPSIIQGYANLGKALVLVGLFIQLISFGIFAVTSIIFHRRLNAAPTTESAAPSFPWLRIMQLLYAMSVLIMIRSVFRVIEYGQGNDGYCLTHEWTLFVFDSVPMLIVAVLFWLQIPDKLQHNLTIGSRGMEGTTLVNIQGPWK